MAISLFPAAKYSGVALAASCLGGGTCFAVHGKQDEKQKVVRQVKITEALERKLITDLKRNIQNQTATCVAEEKARVSKITPQALDLKPWTRDDAPKYNDCLNKIALGDVLENLFEKGKDEVSYEPLT